MLGIIKVNKEEYREGNLGIIDYKITFFGLPIYVVRFTTTNRDIVSKLTLKEEKKLHICGFTNNNENK